MTFVYLTRKDGEWARFDFGDIVQDEDFWAMVERVAPKLWDVLPDESEFALDAPDRFEAFTNVDALYDWVAEANQDNYLVTGDVLYMNVDELEARFSTFDNAQAYAEELWDSLTIEEKYESKIAIFKLPEVEMIWQRGFE